jgi:hypothetical protein
MEYITLNPISKLKTNELWIVQPKWYKWKYELTDNVFVYAKIHTKGFWHGITIFETTDEVLVIKNLWNGGLEIKTAGERVLGAIEKKVMNGSVIFTLSDGSVFTYRAPSAFKSEYTWVDKYDNELMRMDFGAFSGKITVSFDKRASEIPNFSALLFLAFKLKMDNVAHG